MKKTILFSVIFFNLIRPAVADTNIVKLADTIHNDTHMLNGSFNGGTSFAAYDENFSTGYGSDN